MFKKGTAVVALIAITVRLTSLAGANGAVERWLLDAIEGGRRLTAGLYLDTGGVEEAAEEKSAVEVFSQAETGDERLPATGGGVPAVTSAPLDSTAQADEDIIPTTISGGVTIDNATSFEPDIAQLISEGLTQRLPAEGPQILIIHTHGSEAYTPDALDMYTPTDTSRTEDKNFNVIRVGDELTAALEKNGLNVLHDRELYDYPSYTGSYPRSQAAIESYLEQYPNIAVVIDLHRDALGTGGVVYKTVAEVQGESSSQLMLLVGTGENGLSHPNWRENLKLALALQLAVTKKYPTLARPIALKQERYNQHLTTGSLILEVGSSGNTLREALCAVRLFADAISPALLELAE